MQYCHGQLTPQMVKRQRLLRAEMACSGRHLIRCEKGTVAKPGPMRPYQLRAHGSATNFEAMECQGVDAGDEHSLPAGAVLV